MKKFFVLLLSLFLLVTASCSQENVYRDDLTRNIWRVEDRYFTTMQDAADYIIQHQWSSKDAKAISTDDIPESNTAHLMKNVLASKTITDKETDKDGNCYSSSDVYSEDYRKGLAITDTSLTGTMKIDFGGYRYDFYYESTDKDSWFFRIDSGERIDILNGQSVIFNEADHNPYAISVDTKVVTIDAHLLDDRRRDPSDESKSDSNLIYVGENGHLKIEDVQPSDGQNPFEGRIAVVTDGTSGATLDIATSTITVDNIYTMYRNEDGTVSETIASGTAIPEDAKSHININTGDVTILAINQQSDYYDASTGTVFDKAVITFNGTKDNTTITTPHSIQETIDEAVEHSDGDAKHNIVHMMTYYPEVPATCTAEGHRQYWICTDPSSTVCTGRYYLDADGTTWTTNYDDLIIPKVPHTLDYIAAKSPTCQETGNIAYYKCEVCGNLFLDAKATQPTTLAQVTLPTVDHKSDGVMHYNTNCHWNECIWCHCILNQADHVLKEEVITEPLEHTKGLRKIWCEYCDFETTEDIPEIDHIYHVIETVEPTCVEQGYTVSECQNPDCREKIRYDYIPALGHLGDDYIEYKAPTCTETGVQRHYHCQRCGLYFWNKEDVTPITESDWTIPANGHTWGTAFFHNDTQHWHVCTVCGAESEHVDHSYTIYEDIDENYHKLVCECGYENPTHEAHTFITISNTQMKCTKCGYIYNVPSGGFNVTVVDNTPKGHLQLVSQTGTQWTYRFVNDRDVNNQDAAPTKLEWYLKGNLSRTDDVRGVTDYSQFEYVLNAPYPITYQLSCRFINEVGVRSQTVTITGGVQR